MTTATKIRSIRKYLHSNRKVFDRVKWVGNICTYTAALSIVISTAISQEAWPFMLYSAGSTVWLFSAIIMQDRPLMWQHIFFLILNSVGICVRL